MKRLPTLLFPVTVCVLILLASGCGQSGPLYIPGDPSQIATPPSADPDDEEEKKESEPTEKG